MSELNSSNCGREDDLVSCLYGELNEAESLQFQRHLRECAACSSELASFGQVRESVVAWRNEAIGSIGLPAHVRTSSPTRAAQATPSAIAALREFFNLAPLWMKGAAAFAAVLFCVFAGLAIARMGNKPTVASVNPPVAPGQTPAEINALVDQRVQKELQRIKSQEQQSQDLLATSGVPQTNPAKPTGNRSIAIPAGYRQSARRPLSKTEREQLASDLRLVASKGDGDIELLEDRINQ
jgi:anti-sigma factor RsiW